MKRRRHRISSAAARAVVCFATAAGFPAKAQVTVAEWNFANVPDGTVTDIPPSTGSPPGVSVSRLTPAGGINMIGITSAPQGLYKVPGSADFSSPVYGTGMTATTTALDESAFSLNFHVLIEAGSCFRLSGLSFDLGYEHNYNLPGDQYFAPYARLYISTNGTDWVSAGDPLTPSVEDPAAFANRPGGAYFIQTGMAVDLASLQERIFTEGTVLYFRLALAEGASSSTDRRRILIGNILLRGFTEVQNTQHLVVYHNPEEFAGLPANGGLWAWGNELLAGFERWTYNPDPSGRRHLQEPFIGHACARSRDGGLTWTLEPAAPVISPSVLCSFESSRFALRLWKEEFFVSCDRAAEWQGPFSLPKAGGRPNFARSSYIVTGPDSALLLISTEATETHPARSYSARLTNGSNVEFLSWIGDDLFDHAHAPPAADPYSHSIMPSAVRIGAEIGRASCRERVYPRV